MRKIDYSDKTLKNSRIGLSFREKVEIARYLDRLEIEAIELPVIENLQVDSLLGCNRECTEEAPAGRYSRKCSTDGI